MTKEFILAQLNKLHRTDPWVNEVFTAAGIMLDDIADLILDLYHSNWFDTMSLRYVTLSEEKMGITPTTSQTLDDRKSAIQAKWKSAGNVNLELIEAICDSWKNGEVSVAFPAGTIQLTFNSIYGVPDDISTLMAAIDDVKPAHLACNYMYTYRTHAQLAANTHAQLAAYTHEELRSGEMT